MKKIVTALLSAMIIAAPVFSASQASAQDRHYRQHERQVIEKKVVKKKVVTKRWVRGHKMSRDDQRRYREVRDYRAYRLQAPPRGHHWVRTENNDFVLVGIASGIIASVIAGAR